MWRHPWPPDVIVSLISDWNPEGTLTNSNLELAAPVLHETTLLKMCPEVTMAAPRLGWDNKPTAYWIIWEELTTNQVVADLFRICALHL